MTFDRDTTAQEAAAVLKDQIIGKNVLVTGVSTSSLGAETVRAIAAYASTIIIGSRSTQRVEDAIVDIRKTYPSVNFQIFALDLMSGRSIRAAAAEINALGIPIHAVINNAAVSQFNELKRTEEGLEGQIGANHFGHFLFTSLILPSLLASKSASWSPRVVQVASLAAGLGGPLDFNDLQFSKHPENYVWDKSYGQAKNANIMFAKELARRFGKDGILAFSVHPGVIRETGLGSLPPTEWWVKIGILNPDGTPVIPSAWKTIEQGAATQVIAAFDPSLVSSSGAFLNDGALYNYEARPLPGFITSDEDAKKLWEVSEETWGIKFGTGA